MAKSFKQRSVDTHDFAQIPRADIPRSQFRMQKMLKTTFSASYLVPILVEEVLPGDTFNVHATIFCRTATPVLPIMDNLHMETFFFFVPNRLTWTNWVKFQGEQDNPGDSTSFVIPVCNPTTGYQPCSLQDYMGLAVTPQIFGTPWSHSALPLRAYNQIWNQWFRDENLQNSQPKHTGNGPDPTVDYVLMKRGKRHDYFTSSLPFVQKGTAVTIPLGTTAPVIRNPAQPAPYFTLPGDTATRNLTGTAASTTVQFGPGAPTGGTGNVLQWADGSVPGLTPGLITDLSTAAAASINLFRQSFQYQRVLERDARGGTRYTEIIRAHFGVVSPDARLQRPEYLGGGRNPVNIHPIEQNSGTGASGTTTPLGSLAAYGTAVGNQHGFTQSFTEHGYIIGLINVRADLTYQQGVRKHWFRSTRFDFYLPAFAMLGEQPVLNREIFITGNPANDLNAFGYQERWAEYRYNPSEVTGMFKSTTAGTLDAWHLAQEFATLPSLNNTFIQDDTNTVLERIMAAGALTQGQQFLCDIFYDIKAARPLPMYSVPGLIDHF